MLHLIWGLLNIGIFLFFIFICFKATNLLREKAGLFASIIFAFGLLSFIGSSTDKGNKASDSSKIQTWEFNNDKNENMNSTFSIDIELERTLVTQYELGIKYGTSKQDHLNIPISGSSWSTGFVSGTNWQPSSIVVSRTNNNNVFNYYVYGAIEWKLLGTTIYSQPKEYKGSTSIK